MTKHKNRWKCKQCARCCTALSWDKEPPQSCLFWNVHIRDEIKPIWVQVGANAKKAVGNDCRGLMEWQQ